MQLYCPLIALLLVLASPLLAAESAPPARQPADINVMSFNIRFGTAKDGPNHWDKRKDLVAQTIKKYAPDLLGTQETLGFQAAYLREQLPEYSFVGVGRDDGKTEGEMAALFFRTDRFEKLEEGHFWMSETPDKPGSKSWDSALPRVTSWVKLKEKAGPKAGRVTYFFNTHFDHKGKQARIESAKLLRQKIEALGDANVVVTGDFNAAEATPPYQALLGQPQAEKKLTLVDSYRAMHPQRGDQEGTFNGFRDGPGPARIDWIVHTAGLKTIAAGIDRTQRDGRFPSDHYPVWAILR